MTDKLSAKNCISSILPNSWLKAQLQKKYFISDKSLSERRSASSYNITGVLHGDFHHWEKPYLDEWKISKIFSRVFAVANQLLTRHSLYLVPCLETCIKLPSSW